MSARPHASAPPRLHEVAIVGNDALLAALPARPVQLAHAVQACGFDLVVPVSWGEEVLAEHTLRILADRGAGPAVFCACPRVQGRLLAAGPELAPHLLTMASPPAATARYLRALQPEAELRVTYIGSCEGARDPSIDARISPADFLTHLGARGISLIGQPAVFDSVVPPDRRRHLSLPGGCPSSDALASREPDRRLVVLDETEFAVALADRLLAHDRVLIDISARFACACCGGSAAGAAGRSAIGALEPPRSLSPVVDHTVDFSLEFAAGDVGATLPSTWSGSVASLGGAPRKRDDDIARIAGVHPIEEARRRAEHRRIAVTPAHAVVPFISTAPRSPAAVLSETSTAQREPPTAPDRVVSGALRPIRDAGPPRTREIAESPPIQPPIATRDSSAEPSQPTVSRVRRKTPVQEMWLLARAAAQPRALGAEGMTLPRAYAGRRPQLYVARPVADASPASVGETQRPVELAVEPVPPSEAPTEAPMSPTTPTSGLTPSQPDPPAVSDPVSTTTPASVAPHDVLEHMQARARRQIRATPRQVPPPARSDLRRTLIGAVATLIALAAVGIALFAMLRS